MNLAEGQIRGVWQLTYRLTSNLGEGGFSGRMIGPYTHPLTGTVQQLILPSSGLQIGLFIDKVVINYKPTENRDHAAIIDWLVAHPEVWVEQKHTKLEDKYFKNKVSNARIRLVNLDFQDMEEIDNEEFIDELAGRLSVNTGNKAIGLNRIRFIMAKLGLNYRNSKFISDPAIEKKHLRKSLKTYVRKSIANAKEVEAILDNMDEAKFVYEIREMMRLGLLTKVGGMYRYQNDPIGTSQEAIINFFKMNEEFYLETTQKLYAILKSEVQ